MKDEYDFHEGTRGAIEPMSAGKTRITIRLDDDIIAWFRKQVEDAGGGNYQRLINQALHEYIDHQTLEEVLRRILREELRHVA